MSKMKGHYVRTFLYILRHYVGTLPYIFGHYVRTFSIFCENLALYIWALLTEAYRQTNANSKLPNGYLHQAHTATSHSAYGNEA